MTDPDPDLPPAAATPLAAELLVQHAADRAAAPDPEDVAETVRRMALNGLVDPEDEAPFEATVPIDPDGYWTVDLPDRRQD